ncbi:helix-hairpin-helix domain-containing protein [Paucibacter sp. AS339]|uniref:ComEA family DNA-binding protein n=1 Tax=Paucibacter hankyongi TaxID=3133434 RepID=UPI0030AD374C
MALACWLAGSQPAEAQPLLLEANQASRAELESLTGLGPALVERMLTARSEAPFKDWADLRRRVHGIGAATAAKLSAQGLRVAGQAYAEPASPSAPRGELKN